MLPSSFKMTMDILESLLRFTGSTHNLQATSRQPPVVFYLIQTKNQPVSLQNPLPVFWHYTLKLCMFKTWAGPQVGFVVCTIHNCSLVCFPSTFLLCINSDCVYYFPQMKWLDFKIFKTLANCDTVDALQFCFCISESVNKTNEIWSVDLTAV